MQWSCSAVEACSVCSQAMGKKKAAPRADHGRRPEAGLRRAADAFWGLDAVAAALVERASAGVVNKPRHSHGRARNSTVMISPFFLVEAESNRLLHY